MDKTSEFIVQDKSAHISSLNKTPASIIQEFAAKQRLVPQYNLIHNGISQNKVTFKYSLILGNYEAVGEGSSKKEAKHVVAKNMLLQMIKDNPQLLNTEFKQWDFDNHVVSPYDNNIKVNAVGQLNDICSNNKLKLPEFNLVREEGQAHAKLFTISCQVSKMIETATHKTKKQAKHLAAVQMVNKLMSIEESLVSDFDTSFIPNSIKVLEQVEFIKSEYVKKSAPMDENIYNYHMCYNKNESCDSEILNGVIKKYNKDKLISLSNPIETLNSIVQEQEMILVEKYINKSIKYKNGNSCVLCIENVYPHIYGIAASDDISMAKLLASMELIKNICILYA